jgi:hypothetical protein
MAAETEIEPLFERAARLRKVDFAEPFLTLEGLRLVWAQNHQ